jgi:hypothetical protein
VGRAQVNGPAAAFPNFTAQEDQGKNLFFGVVPGGGAPAPTGDPAPTRDGVAEALNAVAARIEKIAQSI